MIAKGYLARREARPARPGCGAAASPSPAKMAAAASSAASSVVAVAERVKSGVVVSRTELNAK